MYGSVFDLKNDGVTPNGKQTKTATSLLFRKPKPKDLTTASGVKQYEVLKV